MPALFFLSTFIMSSLQRITHFAVDVMPGCVSFIIEVHVKGRISEVEQLDSYDGANPCSHTGP